MNRRGQRSTFNVLKYVQQYKLGFKIRLTIDINVSQSNPKNYQTIERRVTI